MRRLLKTAGRLFARLWAGVGSWLVGWLLRFASWAMAWSGYRIEFRPYGADDSLIIDRERCPDGSLGGAGSDHGFAPIAWDK